MNRETVDVGDEGIVVEVKIEAFDKIERFDFMIDTGAAVTVIDEGVMRRIGYTPIDSIGEAYALTASKLEPVYRYEIDNLTALGVTKRNLHVISHKLPETLDIDGLLGLNFFDKTTLKVELDLPKANIELKVLTNTKPTANEIIQ